MPVQGDILPVGDAAALAVVGDAIDASVVSRVWSLHGEITKALGQSVLDVVPAYGSVLVRFNPSDVQLAAVMAAIRGAMETALPEARPAPRTIEVGVCFDPQYGLDIEEVAARTGLTTDSVVEEFCKPSYRVAFLGFMAGFPYLTGLSDKLALPRLASPRVRVPAGSVAFASGQCGIYPRTSPGGWRIVGKTNAVIFDPGRAEPAMFKPGDAVRFHPTTSLDDAGARVAP